MRTVCVLLLWAVLLSVFGCAKPVSPAADTYRKAEEMKVSERFTDALRLYKKAVDIDPTLEKAYLDIAWIYDDQLEDRESAAEWYQRYIDVATNDKMKEKAISWRDEASISADSMKSTSSDELAALSPKTKAIIDKQVALEITRLKTEYDTRQKAADARTESDKNKINEELASIKRENSELLDSVDTLRVENEALQTKVAGSKSQAEIADLLDSPEFSGSNNEIKRNYLQLRTGYDQLSVQYKQTLAKNGRMEKEFTQLRQQLAAAQRVDRADDKSAALQSQVKTLQDENSLLTERVKILESSVDIATDSDLTSGDAARVAEVKLLQNRVASLENDLMKVQSEKHQAEQTLTELSERTDAVLAESGKAPDIKNLEVANRSLNLQIDGIRTEYNKMSQKYADAELRIGELEKDLTDEKKRQKVSQMTTAGEFTDLSDEIKDMQHKLVLQNREIKALTMQNQVLQEKLDGAPKNEVVEKLAMAEDQNQQLKEALAQAQESTASYTTLEERNRELQEQIQLVTADRDKKDQLATKYASRLDEYKDGEDERNKLLEIEVQSLRQKLQASADVSAVSTPRQPITREATLPVGNTVQVDSTWQPLKEGGSLPGTTPRATSRVTTTTPAFTPRTTTRMRQTRTYRVRNGDTLSGISRMFYGNPDQWRKIYKANPAIRQNANALRVGQTLYIPK